ncbi:MAG TPA: carboxypeptidase regulatory-like domain-containing protein [Terracidiphilus sp.]
MDLRKTQDGAGGKYNSPEIRTRRAARVVRMAVLWAAIFSFASTGLGAQMQSALYSAQQPDQAAASPVETTRVTVHGVVRNSVSGEPLARALVQIEGNANTGTLTDGEGHFEIPGVPAGPQTFRVVKPGFHDRPYATEDTSLQAEGPAHSVLVAADMPELAFALTPECAIHGHIELSTGDPAEEMTVMLLKRVLRFGRAVWAMEASTRTNGDGAYRFGDLPDGVYAVEAQPALESEPAVSVVAAGSAGKVTRSGFASVFYPDSHDLAGASRIQLSAGSQAEANFSLALEPFYPVTASGVTPGGRPAAGQMPPGSAAIVMDASGHALPYFPQYDSTTHSMQVSLPDGTYFLLIHTFTHPEVSGDGLNLSSGGGRRSGELAGAVEFTVAGHAVTGLRIPLGAPQAATVHLRLVHSPDSTAPPVNSTNASDLANLTLDPAEGVPQAGGDTVWSMENGADAITFTAQPGSYWLSAYLPRKGLCAGAFSGGGLNLAREPLVLSLGTSPPPMELTLRDDCGTLALTLPAALAAFLPGEEPFYTVYVVPDFDTVVDIPPMTMHPSSGATLNVDGLTPGSYHVYAFDSPVHLEYRNPAALAALGNPGQQVTVTAETTSGLVLEALEH